MNGAGLVHVQPGAASSAAPGVTVTLRWGARCVALTAAWGPGEVGDEHVLADLDTYQGRRLADCADVLTVGRPRSSGAARTWLARALAAHPGAALAAAPLPGGGWAVAAGLRGPEPSDAAPALPSGRGPDASRQALVVGLRAGRHPLVPSCLHAYLVLVPGATLPQLATAEVTVTPHPGRPALGPRAGRATGSRRPGW